MKPYILTILLFAMPATAYAGVKVDTSRIMQIVTIKSDLDAKAQRREVLKQQIARQIAEAKEKSANVLSKEELDKIKAQADAVIEKAQREIDALNAELGERRASSAINDQRLETIKQRLTDKAFVITELNRWISELIIEEANEKKDHSETISFLNKFRADYIAGRPMGAMIVCSSQIIEEVTP